MTIFFVKEAVGIFFKTNFQRDTNIGESPALSPLAVICKENAAGPHCKRNNACGAGSKILDWKTPLLTLIR
jgi:hypothetical protein